jgi:hypothetical protein
MLNNPLKTTEDDKKIICWDMEIVFQQPMGWLCPRSCSLVEVKVFGCMNMKKTLRAAFKPFIFKIAKERLINWILVVLFEELPLPILLLWCSGVHNTIPAF